MVRISSPVLEPSLGFTLAMIFLLRISFDSMQAIIPLLPILNQDPTDVVKDKFITEVPVIFSIIEFCVIIVASILCDTIISLDCVLKVVLLLWPPVLMCFFITDSRDTFMILIRIMAIFKGIIQPIILSIGIQKYNSEDYKKIYLYFMLTYCAYVAGGVGAEAILGIDVVENSMCGNISCIELAYLCAICAGFLGMFIYMLSSSYFDKQNDLEIIENNNDIFNIGRLLVVYIPYIIFWIFYQRVQPQLTSMPLLVNMYYVTAYGMPKLFLEIKLMFAIIYYLIYRIFQLYIIQFSIVVMTVGGILIGIWSIMAASMVKNHRDQYIQAGPINPDAIQITYLCATEKPVYIDIPYYENPRCDAKGDSPFTINRDQILVLRENNKCPYIIFPENTINYCLNRGQRYFVVMCQTGSGVAFHDYGERDPGGRAVVCVMLMREAQCNSNQNPIDIVLYSDATAKSDAKQYSYMLYSSYFEENQESYPAWKELCQTIEPNVYTIRVEGNRVGQKFDFGPGGVYYFSALLSSPGYWNITSVEPYKSTLINTPLLWMSIVRAIGEYLLIINGFFSVFIFIKPKCRTIAIAIWLMMIKFGVMIYEVEYHNDIYFQHGDLYKLGGILIWMPILSLIFQYFCCAETFVVGRETSVEKE